MASDEERRQLENRVHQLLLKHDGVILLNSFWSSYQQVYKELPDPAKFGQCKRNALLSIFPSVCTVDSAPVPQRKVWAKDIKRQDGLIAGKDTASGEAASQQPKQSVRQKEKVKVRKKVKQPDVKFAGLTDIAEALTTCTLRESEGGSADLLPGDTDKFVDPGKNPEAKLSESKLFEFLRKPIEDVKASKKKTVPAKLPLSKQDLNLEESNIAVIPEAERNVPSLLQEPAKMASSRRQNTHVRFGDDDVNAAQVPRMQQQQMHHHSWSPQMHNSYGTHPPRGPPYNQLFAQSPGYNNRNTQLFPHEGAQSWNQRPDPVRQPVPTRHPAPQPHRPTSHSAPQPQRTASQSAPLHHRPMPSLVSRIPEDQMKNVVEDSIDRLVESKEYVSLERIEKLITQHFHVASLAELGIRGVDTIASVRDHQRMLCKVNAYIQAFVMVRAVATAYELGECLKTYVTDGRDFDSLRLGPLVAQPLVYEFFKMPGDCDVPAVMTHDIYEHLRGFLNEKDLWTDRSVQLEDFMQYLTEQYDVDTPFKLGIRIRSMPLLIGVLKKAQRECARTMASLPTHLRDMIDGDLMTATNRFLMTLIHKEPGICMVRQQCLNMTAPQLFKHVFCKFSVLVEFVSELQTMHPKSALVKVARHCKTIQVMLNGFNKDELMMKLFQFVVCVSNQDMHGQLQEILALEYGRAAGREEGTTGQEGSKELPALEKVVTQIRKYLERCLTHGALSLSNLARVEEKLLEDFTLTYFSDLGRGGFLQFLLDTSNIKQFLDECGGLTLGGASGGVAAESIFHPSFSALLEFVHQFGVTADKAQHSALEGALCIHYRVKEVKCLGHGSMAHLVTSIEKQSKHNQESIVYYEGALCASNRTTVFSTTGHQVGLLGHVTKEKALACLQCCPLLEDMSEWSHWQFVFKPELGELREFLHKYGGVRTIHVARDNGAKIQMMTNIVALETSPGTLLRISANSTPEAFATAAADADVAATCCHLVSLVAANRGMSNMPQALLANHMMTALLKIQGRHAQQTVVPPGVDDAGSTEVVQFVLDCLVKMPLIICEAIANQVLLEPLGKVLGSTKSKALLLRLADSGLALTRLQLLGWLLGHADWTDSFTERFTPPADGVTVVPDDNSFGDVIEVLDSSNESDDDDDDDNDDYENSILVLSDDEDDDVVQIPDGVTTIIDTVKSEKDADASVSIKLTSDDDTIMVDATDEPVDTVMKSADDDEVTCSDDDRCRLLVEQIRSDEFGIGVALGEDGERLMRKQQERLGRSLDRLSRDLYNKDTHFVLELIQNADDNSYPDDMFGETATTSPAVKFVVESDCIVVYNNECGFEEQNIRAVCDVGRTTKGKHKYGYIGQKGIGFKSVFRVTDCPKIHSNGFHICFDVKSSPMGYILPHWIGEDGGRYATGDSWKTLIELPLKEDMLNQTQCRSLAARFHDVHPSLLLFLHRLKRLTVENKVEGVTTNIERRDLGSGVVEIRHNNIVDRWLVVKHMLDASAISLQAKSGIEIESTEVALAFALHTQEKGLAQTQPEKQRVFAFLPLRSYGFRFVIQGDFDVPASRGDVDRDSMWNQWLRSELHLVFVQALQHFKSHPEFSEIEAVTYFLRFIPLEDEILEFFKPVASAILQLLRREPCLPTEGATDTGVRWKLPSQLVLTKDPLVRDVITSALLRDQLGLDFLHKDVAAILNPSLMTSLGVQVLMTSHLIEIGKVIVSRMNCSNTVVRQHATADVAKWLACVYRSLDEFDSNEELMAKLKDVVVVPLMSGEVVSLATKRTVFFPIDSAEQMRHEKTKTERPLEALMCDLSMLHPAFLASLDSVSRSQVSHLLEQLGVKHLEPQDIVKHHIMPTLQSDAWKTRPSTLLVSYIVYVKQQWDRNRALIDMNELRAVAVVMTNQGIRRPADEPVHLSRRYGNKIDLPGALPAYDWLMLHDCYAGSSGANWREFFLELGVTDFLAVKERAITITPTELESTPWSVYKTMLPAADQYKIADYESTELEALVRSCSGATSGPSTESLHRQMRTLFELIDDRWDAEYSRYAVTHIADGNGHALRRDVDTTFATVLKSSPWLPSCVMRVVTDDGRFAVTLCHETAVASELFVRVPEISHLLGDHVPYLEARVGTKSTFAAFLGIKNSVKVEFVVGLLQGWCERKVEGEARQFRTSKQHIQAIYRYLFENMPPKQLQDLVHSTPLIFVAGSLWQDRRAMVDGVFRGRDELRWDDPSCLFAKYRESLTGSDSAGAYRLAIRPLYADMEDFFLQCARVQRAPELSDHAQLLVHVASTVQLPQALPDVLLIFTIIGDVFAREPDLVKGRVAELTKVLRASSVIPVKGCRWVSRDSHAMVADDKAMERLFQGKEGVYFVDLGERLGTNRNRGRGSAEGGIDNDLVMTCLKELGVATLSECLSEDYVTEMYEPCRELQQYVHNVLPMIQTLLCNEFHNTYATLVAGGMADKIKAMSFVKVGRLELVYRLKNKPETVTVLSEKCHLVRDKELCVHRNHVDSFNEVNKELARYFSIGNMQCRNEIRDLLLELLPLVVNPSWELQQFVKQRRLNELPSKEEPWLVEEPVYYRQPQQTQVPQHFEETMNVDEGQIQQGSGNLDNSVGDNSGGLRAWPPRSGNPDMRQRGSSSTAGGGSHMWPPPAPPKGVDYTALPLGLRPSKLPFVSREGAPSSHQTADGGHVSRGSVPHSAVETSGVAGITTNTHDSEIKYLGPGHMSLHASHTLHTTSETVECDKSTPDGSTIPVHIQNHEANSDSSAAPTQTLAIVTADVNSEANATPLKKRRRSESLDAYHRKTFMDSAVWLQDNETPYEHVDIGALTVPEGLTPNEDDSRVEEGRWGEQLVYSYLVQSARHDPRIISVTWINEDQETNDPYDIVMTMGSDRSNVSTIYIEVKSTVSDTKNFFEMSLQQIHFACDKNEAFHLYRVFNAGQQVAVRLMRLENLALKLNRKKVRLCMFV